MNSHCFLLITLLVLKSSLLAESACNCKGFKPICDDMGGCRACMKNTDCEQFYPDAPVCLTDGSCDRCVKSSECTTSYAPICQSGRCIGCQNSSECFARGPELPLCLIGSCAKCIVDSDCTQFEPSLSCIDGACKKALEELDYTDWRIILWVAAAGFLFFTVFILIIVVIRYKVRVEKVQTQLRMVTVPVPSNMKHLRQKFGKLEEDSSEHEQQESDLADMIQISSTNSDIASDSSLESGESNSSSSFQDSTAYVKGRMPPKDSIIIESQSAESETSSEGVDIEETGTSQSVPNSPLLVDKTGK